jgi:hypothetical protein
LPFKILTSFWVEMQIWTSFISTEKFGYKIANFKPHLAYDALEHLSTLRAVQWSIVLLRIPDFRDRDFRIFKPILKKGFESDPDL